jgi:hypothetical protein
MRLLFALLLSAPSLALADYRPQSDWEHEALAVMRRENKSVIETMFPRRGSLWASMRDNGSRRDGYAQTICMQLNEAGKPRSEMVIVRIWDAAAMARGELREIGRADCP